MYWQANRSSVAYAAQLKNILTKRFLTTVYSRSHGAVSRLWPVCKLWYHNMYLPSLILYLLLEWVSRFSRAWSWTFARHRRWRFVQCSFARVLWFIHIYTKPQTESEMVSLPNLLTPLPDETLTLPVLEFAQDHSITIEVRWAEIRVCLQIWSNARSRLDLNVELQHRYVWLRSLYVQRSFSEIVGHSIYFLSHVANMNIVAHQYWADLDG